MAHIARQVREPWQAALIAHGLHRLRQAAAPHHGRAHRFLRRVALPPCISGGKLEMQPQFLFQILIVAARPECSVETIDPLAQRHPVLPGHASSCKSEWMISDMRSQAAFSLAS